MKPKARIVIVEDHEMLRKSIVALLDLSADLVVIGEAEDGLEAILYVPNLKPDLLLLDYRLPLLNGIEVTKILISTMPSIKILVFSMYDDLGLASAAINAGAMGFCHKFVELNVLKHAIQSVLNGSLYINTG